ncbi:early endosome antigen 1-like [Halyomorpha halys]|uniref:early endosome antigen 1-like n=1 Tax=Halyomorpha halys TaxID=286706 RepID=UPI0034D3312D
MFRRPCNSWQDIRDLDEPGTFKNECKTLLDQIINFNYSEAPIYGQATQVDVEKQDVSYRLLEEENFVLKEQVMSLQQLVESKSEEIAELKSNICQLKSNKQVEPCVEEVSLPDVKNIIKMINSTIEDFIESDNTDGSSKIVLKNSVSNLRISDPGVGCDESNPCSTNAPLSNNVETVNREIDVIPPESSINIGSSIRGSKSNLIDTVSGTSRGESFLTMEENYLSLKRENITLQDKIKTLTDRVTLLKSSLKSCELELVQYDKILSLIKQERFNLISELRETKHCYNALKLRNEYLEERVVELENRLKLEASEAETSSREEVDDCTQIEVLNCYKTRLYDAFREMSVKEEQIGLLNESINSLVEKFKTEKSLLEVEYAGNLKGSADKLQQLCEENVKMEETIRQQSKLIDHLQTMVESRDKKHNSVINWIKDN